MSGFVLKTNVKAPKGFTEEITIKWLDKYLETTIGRILVLFPWLFDAIGSDMCCGVTPCSIIVIPDTKVETLKCLVELVVKGSTMVDHGWVKDNITSLLSFTFVQNIEIFKTKCLQNYVVCPSCKR